MKNVKSNSSKKSAGGKARGQRPQTNRPAPYRKLGPSQPRQPGLRSVSAAAAYAKGQRSSEPRISGNYRKTNICHRELLASISGTSTFTVASTIALNPGLSSSFPWLSTQAIGWEQYRFNKLKFCYYSRTGTSTPGSVILVPDYDAADVAPTSEQISSAYRDAVEEVPWVEEFSCTLDPSALHPNGPRKFVRIGNLAANLDIKTYDGGNFFVCTNDGTAVNWGKLWVEYDVDLFIPQLPPTGGATSESAKIVGNGSVSKTAMFGATPTITGTLQVTGLNAVLTFQTTGQFLVTLDMTGTVFVAQSTVSASTAAVVNLLALGNAAGTEQVEQYTVNVTSVGQTFSAVQNSTTLTAVNCRIGSYQTILG